MDRYWHSSFNGIAHGLPILSNYRQLQPEQQLYQQHTIQSIQQQHHHHLLQQDASRLNQHHHIHQQQHHHHHQIQQQQPQPQQTQQQFYTQPHIASASATSQTMQLHLPPNQAIYVSTDSFGTAANTAAKMTAYMPHGELQQQLPIATTAATSTAIGSNSSPVVLDRINICINNHYSDSGGTNTGTSPIAMSADTPPLPSPIIPTIQYTGAIDPSYLVDSSANNNNNNNNEVNSNAFTPTTIPPVISEPDSTTTSNTPPTTPETTNPVHLVTTIQSPSTSSSASETDPKLNGNSIKLDEKEIICIQTETDSLDKNSSYPIETLTSENDDVVVKTVESPSVNRIESLITAVIEISFAIGEDVFVRKEDDRLYLGTIIDSKYQKYRIRFDDKSELWCSAKEMRKFGNFTASPDAKFHNDNNVGVLCVACKVRDQNGVEICERCGRGYHHNCTMETSPGNGDWLCKRCDKPMKLKSDEIENNCREPTTNQQQLPYDIYSLTWDAKHRVNQEQIYCYCGKTGQFDHNMLQCCKCLNWYHIACIDDFEEPMLRGDGNFIFCCSICSTDGKEFLRRLQTNTIDFVHLILYNLSAQRKHQQHKYHHLTKDIFPFVLAQRQTTALPEEWHELSEDALKDNIAATLKENPERFICGREVKRDCFYYGLRNNGPPIPPKIDVQKEDVLDDIFIAKRLRLKLSRRAMKQLKNNNNNNSNDCNEDPKRTLPTSKDIYEFHSDKEEIDMDLEIDDDDDEKFTSDDEIPIKHILEKEKRNETQITTNVSKFKSPTARLEEKDCQIEIVVQRSHKRKAFTLSKPYKETAAAAAAKRYHSVRNCDSSSDENSSSSRGTSLDLIIPPPKDFLGPNNPFRNVTPKKNAEKKSIIPFGGGRSNSGGGGGFGGGGTAIKNCFLNTSSLDFSSKLAALKSAGMFPNLNATSLAKAAGQPRMVRTIKRRLSAKDIMIGPNQEVRRRRTRRLSANIEVISTTTINPLPSNIFPINAKDLFISGGAATIRKQSTLNNAASSSSSSSLSPPQLSSHSSALSFREQFTTTTTTTTSKKAPDQSTTSVTKPPTHGRRLRARIQKPVNNNSRRSSLSGASTSSTSSVSCAATAAAAATTTYTETPTLNDLQQSVNKYFGAGNRIRDGEKFSIYAKRHLPNGQVQYLIEWGNENGSNGNAETLTNAEAESPLVKLENSNIE